MEVKISINKKQLQAIVKIIKPKGLHLEEVHNTLSYICSASKQLFESVFNEKLELTIKNVLLFSENNFLVIKAQWERSV